MHSFAEDGERVDISNLKNDEIHELLKSKGFERIEAPKEEEQEQEAGEEDKSEAQADAKQPKKPQVPDKQELLEKMKNIKLPFMELSCTLLCRMARRIKCSSVWPAR